MPTYEFRCPDGHEFEKFYRSIGGAESHAVCPVCGTPAERMMSAAGFAFKGSGFYLTDYGKNAHRGEAPPQAKSGAAAASESSSDSPKSDGAKSETAAATKSERAKGDSSKGDSAKGSESSSSSSEAKKTESKAADAKPAPAAPKPSASE